MYAKTLRKAASGGNGGSVSFTSAGTYTWTAPEGVYFVKSLTGIGGDGTYYYEWVSASPLITINSSSSSSGSSATLDYSTVQAKMDSIVNTLNALDIGESIIASLDYNYWFSTINNQWFEESGGAANWRRQGTISTNSTLDALSGTVPTPPSTVQYAPTGSIEKRRQRYDDGNDSSALGYTFAGDDPEAEYNGIPVTPHQEYTIIVGDVSEYGGTSTEGSITITW
jgi:hypothetical protein